MVVKHSIKSKSGVIPDGPCWVRLWCDLGVRAKYNNGPNGVNGIGQAKNVGQWDRASLKRGVKTAEHIYSGQRGSTWGSQQEIYTFISHFSFEAL